MTANHQEIDLSFLQEANWPKLPSANSEVGKNHHNWLSKISNCVKLLYQRVEALEMENSTQKFTIKTLSALVDSLSNQSNQPSQISSSFRPQLSWSKIVSGMAHKDDNAVAIMATLSTEMKKKKERANNVIVSIPATTFDCEEGCEVDYVQGLANRLGVPGSKVKKARKISRARDRTANTINNRVLLVVEMESPGARADLIRSSRKLRDDNSHIYINEDLTPSERITQRKLREERDSRNNLLPESETFNGRVLKFKTCTDGKKRFWGIRNGELKMITSLIDRI